MKSPTVPAFTIIELLVVITIISVLLTVLLPAMQNAREQATILSCQSRQRGLDVAIISYATDSLGFFPNSYVSYGAGPNEGAGVGTTSANNCTSANNLLLSYFQGLEGLYCPTFYHYYWPTPNGAYKTYKTWQPGQDIYYGYNKFAGSFGASGAKPLALYATIGGNWADIGNLGRYLNTRVGGVKNPDDPSYISAYFRPYASLGEIDAASIGQWNGNSYAPIQILGPAGAILWEDMNTMSNGNPPFRETAHNTLFGAAGNKVSAPLDYTTGFNSAFGDGHVEWTVNTSKSTSVVQTKSIIVNDGQSTCLVRSARY